MGNKSELFHKYVDKYIRENYTRLEGKFRAISNKINDKGISSLDKLNDTMINLNKDAHRFNTYEEFEKWANNKFTPKKERCAKIQIEE